MEFKQSIILQKIVDSLVLQQEQNKLSPAYQLQLTVSPNGLEWPPTANGDHIIFEFHGICSALLHHCKDSLLKGKSLTGQENSVLSIKLVGRGLGHGLEVYKHPLGTQSIVALGYGMMIH